MAVHEEDPEHDPDKDHGAANREQEQLRGAGDQRCALRRPELRETILIIHDETAEERDDLLMLLISALSPGALGRGAGVRAPRPRDDVSPQVLQLGQRVLQPVVHPHLAPQQQQQGPEWHNDGPAHQVDPQRHDPGVAHLEAVVPAFGLGLGHKLVRELQSAEREGQQQRVDEQQCVQPLDIRVVGAPNVVPGRTQEVDLQGLHVQPVVAVGPADLLLLVGMALADLHELPDVRQVPQRPQERHPARAGRSAASGGRP
mmetsp:Transcript_26344/g.61829  ORF Transcript_26344/g.61829 Transcript_26344/m.61829 type:complete len:258 (+) Transcript_26344:375-1148(+)